MTNSRLQRLWATLQRYSLPGLILSSLPNLRYLSGFTGSSGIGLVTPEHAFIATDSRYHLQVRQECPDFDLIPSRNHPLKDLAERIKDLRLPRLAFEQDSLIYSRWYELKRNLPQVELVPTRGIVENLRLYKDNREIRLIREACQLVDSAFEYILPLLRPGITEKEVALEIDFYLRKHGAEGVGFETIVASGFRSALPHAHPTEKPLEPGDLVTLDFGAVLGGYHSDITRTVCLSPATAKHREVYSIVLEAQKRGIQSARAGAISKEVDASARNYIKEQGYGDCFGHSLGHSLGVEVHDGGTLSFRSELLLQPGMVFTVEPGIYIEGWGGVRIEDDILITRDQPEVLTKSPKEFMEL